MVMPIAHSEPTVQQLRVGDQIEGYGGRALPRRREILGITTNIEETRLIYRERRGTEDIYDTLTLPNNTPVDIAPTI